MPISLPKLERRPELDALRGLFLVWMTLTHLPTRFSDLVNQPFGFLSSAEGFVFLSALLVARISARQMADGGGAVRHKLWHRALELYGYHVLMLALAFTLAANIAVKQHKVAIYNLLNFYLDHPVTAVAGSLLLVYTPPLLDILPMYVEFLLITPLILSLSRRIGWTRVMLLSTGIWLAAQYGLRAAVHRLVVEVTGLRIPLEETGAFNLFAWQWVWCAGLWIGATSAFGANPLRKVRPWMGMLAGTVCLVFIGIRHDWLGPRLTVEALGVKLDKWSIGPLRLVNLVAFAVLFYWLRRWVTRMVSVEPFLTLGKASLEVFCAHIFFVFAGLALLAGDVPELHGVTAYLLVAVTMTGLILVAVRVVRRRRGRPRSSPAPGRDPESPGLPPGSAANMNPAAD